MAKNITENINYYLAVPENDLHVLGSLSHFENLKMSTNNGTIWIKDITEAQIHLLEVQSILHKNIYVEKENKLFPLGSNLPAHITPALLWTPIARAIKIQMPDFNHNYFGLPQNTDIQLVKSTIEKECFALLIDIITLKKYLHAAPKIRLRNLRCTIFSENFALVLGTPMLPLQGDTYWRCNNMVLPAGYDLELPILQNIIETQINGDADDWIFWDTEANYCLLPKHSFVPLCKSAFSNNIIPIKNN